MSSVETPPGVREVEEVLNPEGLAPLARVLLDRQEDSAKVMREASGSGEILIPIDLDEDLKEIFNGGYGGLVQTLIGQTQIIRLLRRVEDNANGEQS